MPWLQSQWQFHFVPSYSRYRKVTRTIKVKALHYIEISWCVARGQALMEFQRRVPWKLLIWIFNRKVWLCWKADCFDKIRLWKSKGCLEYDNIHLTRIDWWKWAKTREKWILRAHAYSKKLFQQFTKSLEESTDWNVLLLEVLLAPHPENNSGFSCEKKEMYLAKNVRAETVLKVR